MVRKKWLEPAVTDLNDKRTENAGMHFYASTDSSSGSSNKDDDCSSNDSSHPTYQKQHGLI